jgi:hypothetical protein
MISQAATVTAGDALQACTQHCALQQQPAALPHIQPYALCPHIPAPAHACCRPRRRHTAGLQDHAQDRLHRQHCSGHAAHGPGSGSQAGVAGAGVCQACKDPRFEKKVKRVSRELGVNSTLLIFDDADLELAAKGVVGSKLRNRQPAMCSQPRTCRL